MAEDIRRSGRATKGQHTKDREVTEDAPTSRKGKGKDSKAKPVEEEPEEEDELIRCVCDEYEEEEDNPRAMICCDQCSAWEHNGCIGLAEDYAPDQYFCEQCKPEHHKELLAAIARGEKPWAEAAKKRVEAEKSSKKKGVKKGRKSGTRLSEAPSRASQDTEEAIGRGSNKRKLEESPSAGDTKDIKKVRATPETSTKPTASKRKSNSLATPSRQPSRSEVDFGDIVADVSELRNDSRKAIATSLVKLFVEQTNNAVKQGVYSIPAGSTAENVGTQVALRVEHALYNVKSTGSGEPIDAYRAQARSITFNVRKNHGLRDSLLSGELSASALASMDPSEMASEEQQRKDAETKKAMEKQHTIIQDQGQRNVRRTHKGEEFVNEADQVAAESVTSNAPAARRESAVDRDGDTAMDDPRSPTEPGSTKVPSVNAQGRSRPSREPQRQSSTNFDINNVWSSVQGSPDVDRQPFPELPQTVPGGPVQEPAGPGTKVDPEIDELLKDEDVESEPYSPKDDPDSNDVVWRGVVNGNSLGRFTAAAQYAAGCSLDDLNLTWQELIPSELSISGRIDPSKADDYLCGLQYSTTSDVVVVSIRPPHDKEEKAQFNRLFDYFKSRNRYGVAIQHKNPAIKDIYLIPLEVGQSLPELLELLGNEKIQGPITERIMMVPFVVKNTELGHAGAPTQQATSSSTMPQTPITPHEGQSQFDQHLQHQQQPPPGFFAQHQQPYPPQQHPHNSNGTPTPTPSYQQLNGPPTGYTPPSTIALNILGPLATAPALRELLHTVPNADARQLSIIKEICDQDPRVPYDLNLLTQALHARSGPPSG